MVARLKDTILLVGGNVERAALREIFGDTYDTLEAESIRQAVMLMEQNYACIACVMMDISKPKKAEAAMMMKACRHGTAEEIPIVAFIHQEEKTNEAEGAFTMGVSDVVSKPYEPSMIRRRVQVIIDAYLYRWQLERAVAEQSETIRRANQVMMDALSAIIEHRSTESGKHVLRIRSFTRVLLEEVAKHYPEYNLTEETIGAIASAAALHDIGKISIPDDILNKPGKLTAEEFEVMKTHTTVGGELVHQLEGSGDEEYLRYAYNIAMYHHERWDGRGYPAGLKGDEIPICAQVVGIADAYDALTTERSYKKAFSCATAVNMILNGECGAFSPELYECFKGVRGEFAKLAVRYADGHSPKNDNITAPLPKPLWRKDVLDGAQMAQIKYQTLLHHMGDTMIEMNLDDQVYHVVYNPYAVAEPMTGKRNVRALLEQLLDNAHPEDAAAAAELRSYINGEFFTSELRRKQVFLRFFEAGENSYHPYRVTLLRLNTKNAQQRMALLVLHQMVNEAEVCTFGKKETLSDDVRSSPALHGLLSTALRCRCDERMTLHGGEAELHYLTSYTPEEIAAQFGGSYLAMVYEEDRLVFSAAMLGLQENLSRGEIEYRLKCKDGSVRWVLDKCRGYLEEDGQVFLYHALTDYTRIKDNYRNYEEDIQRNRAIIEMSNGIVFEWDMASDTMYCSPKWEEHFGYAPISKNYGSQMGIATHFHPDDLPVVREAIRQATEEHGDVAIDVRIADSNAKYLWTHISGTVQLNEDGELKRIIGILQDVDAVKRAEFALREKAERDALTQLFNKATTEQLISDAMSGDSKELSALLVLDLDNFKTINDTYGHLYGDAVLTKVGTTLKKLFREKDVIGRIGGDEFVVFLQNIPSVELVHNRCKLLADTLRSMMQETAPELTLSCSVGAALFPENGRDYATLFHCADEALYHAKSCGKDTYAIYDNAMESIAGMDLRSTTDIDSDRQPHLADGSFVHAVFRRLYESRDLFATIDGLLGYVGEQLNVDRVYIFENNADNTTCSNTFEWCNVGITPEKENLQDVSYVEDIAGWDGVYDENGIFYCTDITTLAPHFRAILEPQGIKSMLQCAIYDNGVFRGYVGFDDCTINRFWTKEQIGMLQFLAEIMVMFLLKKRAQENLQDTVEKLLMLLNKQQDWVYVVEPKSYRIDFLNTAAKELSPEAQVGMVCYEALHHHSEPCENCPLKDLGQEEQAEAVIYNEHLKICASVRATKVNWKGREVALMNVHEIEK